VAIESGADGLHLGQGDGDVAAARAAMGEQAILGLSVQNHAQLARLDSSQLDYLGLGPVFATSTKHDHAQPLGFDGLASLVAASSLPAVAIGGLEPRHVEKIRAAGAKGPAVVSAICGQADPETAARAFYPL